MNITEFAEEYSNAPISLEDMANLVLNKLKDNDSTNELRYLANRLLEITSEFTQELDNNSIWLG